MDRFVFGVRAPQGTEEIKHSLWCSTPQEKPQETAVVFGVTGQDGTYLAEELLRKGYKVVGVSRRSSDSRPRLEEDAYTVLANPNFEFIEGDITDLSSIITLLREHKPIHVYNLAAQSHVKTSFDQPLLTFDVTGKGAWNILEAIRLINPKIRFYQASSSEMFGDQFSVGGGDGDYQDENTRMNPQSPYAIAKLAAYNLTRLYRNAYGIFSTNGILFNHESPRRGDQFVTQKICKYIGELKACGKRQLELDCLGKLHLGNLDACRDWGHARDYCKAMIMMLEHDTPDDFVIATGETHTVKDFLIAAFAVVGIDNYKDYVVIDENLKRPAEVPFLRGKPTKAQEILGWTPETSFKELVKEMVNDAVYKEVQR